MTPPFQPGVPSAPKPGPKTTEFWVTVVTLLLSLLAAIFPQDISSQAQVAATAAAGVASALYVLSRALTKSAQVKASAGAVPTDDGTYPTS